MHHRVGYFGMKLQREGAPAADRLHFENIALGKKLGAGSASPKRGRRTSSV
jgi:hypothetical protein